MQAERERLAVSKHAEIQRLCIFEHVPGDDGYDEAALDSMIANFSGENASGRIYEEIGERLNNPLVVGHEEDQELLERSDLPAAGWIAKIWREGRKLFGRAVSVPVEVAEAIGHRAYRHVSAEIYQDYRGLGPTLRRVALLGGDIPARKTLGEIALQTYTEDGLQVDRFTQTLGGLAMAEENKKTDAEKKVDALEAKITKMTEDAEKAADLEAKAKAEKAKADADAKAAKEKEEASAEDRIVDLEKRNDALESQAKSRDAALAELRSARVEDEANAFAEKFVREKGVLLVGAEAKIAEAHKALALDTFAEGKTALALFRETLEALVPKTETGGRVREIPVVNEKADQAEYDAWAETQRATGNFDEKKFSFDWWKKIGS